MASDMGSEEMTRSGRKNWGKHTILYGIFVSMGVGVGVVGVGAILVRCKCDAYPRSEGRVPQQESGSNQSK